MIYAAIERLLSYALTAGLSPAEDLPWLKNRLLSLFGLPGWEEDNDTVGESLPEILQAMTGYAAAQGLLPQDSPTGRDLFDTRIMGEVTPPPSAVVRRFRELESTGPQAATDWFYHLCQDCHYIRSERVARDIKWKTPTPYGELDITVNLSKPEKDPKAIAAARSLPATSYPACALCRENEGYAGRLDTAARQNLRLIPISLGEEPWFFQYSPYVYYPEHCIILSGEHRPMRIDRATFRRLLEFVSRFPHYFVGSNADLPIVGGSILSHEHFQGGRYVFAMERAPIETPLSFPAFPGVRGGIVRWPMSVLRLRSASAEELVSLAGQVLDSWRDYSDPAVSLLSHTGDTPHNTITPIARMREGQPELDLVLRNNRTTEEHPLGLFHPHAPLHHIKKENIGLIEVMGLAVLPARLKEELALLEACLLTGKDPADDPRTAKHAPWAAEIAAKHPGLTRETCGEVLRQEVGLVFSQVLEHCGVFKQDEAGRAAFLHFVQKGLGGAPCPH